MTNHLKKISKYKPSILQGSLQFEVARPRTGLALEHPYERHALSILGILLVALVAAYLYFVASSVLNVIARADAMAQIRDIQSSIGSIEQQYLALSQEVNPERASELGLTPVSKTAYVYRAGNTAVATTQVHEI